MTGVLLAHAGHYALYVLYAVPVVVVLGSIVLAAVRERRERRAGCRRHPSPSALIAASTLAMFSSPGAASK